MTARAVLLGTFLLAQGCARLQRTDDGAPMLAALTPDSVHVSPGAVIEVTIAGTGFRAGDPGENTVHFGTAVLRKVRANASGTRIVFALPDAMDSGGEAPPSPLITGGYPVQVETPGGRSNVLTLRVFR